MNDAWFRKICTFVFVLLVIFFFFLYVKENWEAVSRFEFTLQTPLFFLSLLAWTLSYSGFAFLWRRILLGIDPQARISRREALKFYMLTEFSKYIPGSIWTVVSRAYYGKHLNTNRRNVLGASAIDAVLTTTVMLTVGGVFLLFHFSNTHLWLVVPVFFFSALGFIILNPKILHALINFVFKKFRREPLTHIQLPSHTTIFLLSLRYGMLYIANAISFFIFVSSITPLELNQLSLVAAAYLLSIGFGVAVFFAPSGLGVREGIMTYLLAFVVVTPLPLFIALFARLWMTLGEVILLGISLTIANLPRKYTPQEP